jgi:chromate reductase, NAD(P)H dehydrogenase (quinone)
MILIIAGTNRLGSNTLKIATHYQKVLIEKGQEVKLLSLERLTTLQKDANFIQLEETYLKPATKYIIISPEYNGTFPGILKLLFDLSDIRNVWTNKKVALVGISNGRAGNLRGLDHLTNMLHYIKVNVMPNKLPISLVNKMINETNGAVTDEATIDVIETQIDEIIKY